MSLLRIAMIVPTKDPLGPRGWSGTPHGLAEAFRAHGADVTAIGHFFSPLTRKPEAALARLGGRTSAVVDHAPTRVAARGASFQRQLDTAGDLDLVVAIGTDEYRLERLRIDAPVVTYDDGTLHQMWAHPDSDIANGDFPPRAVARWIRTQRDSLRAADVVCVSTGWAGQSMTAHYGIDADRVHVVGMGHRPRVASAAREWSVPVFLFVGVDWRRKNGARVLSAFARVREQHPDAVLHLVGGHPPIAQAGVVAHGHLRKDDPGAQRTLDDLFATATAFVLPSLFDPSPIAYLEAASAGIPVIATDQGGAGELLGDAAIVVSPTDDDDITEAMLTLAVPQEARRRGELGAQAASNSSWHAVTSRILGAAGIDAAEVRR